MTLTVTQAKAFMPLKAAPGVTVSQAKAFVPLKAAPGVTVMQVKAFIPLIKPIPHIPRRANYRP
ncbi:hypothetical protein [Novosphingobium clariflavum]|uniref:Uncharacterized protein n=1 Tax=Novosphingobium clariflavum TaxID=2029884 RepID=A0ABV6SB84_9SPHN|nr:hypothetical protein [Novosphingobium clariflavum]